MKDTEHMQISFDKLFLMLKERKIKEVRLREAGISSLIIKKMKDRSGHIDTRTIQKICRLLHCQPGEMMEYIEDKEKE